MESRKSGILSRTKDGVVRKKRGLSQIEQDLKRHGGGADGAGGGIFNQIGGSATAEWFAVQEVSGDEDVLETILLVRQRKVGEQGVSVFSADVVIAVMLEFSTKIPGFAERPVGH